ncbi:uncharacterized protein LOC122234682 [Panthera tigris]|uniref:uncharacterized protein LOC122234682 n=1 Tax=Panthera tigris TaxID=9694 RepID=UPI001C6F874F|nr:uncharacterized protein LOC122234682 [Panthera tigris]
MSLPCPCMACPAETVSRLWTVLKFLPSTKHPAADLAAGSQIHGPAEAYGPCLGDQSQADSSPTHSKLQHGQRHSPLLRPKLRQGEGCLEEKPWWPTSGTSAQGSLSLPGIRHLEKTTEEDVNGRDSRWQPGGIPRATASLLHTARPLHEVFRCQRNIDDDHTSYLEKLSREGELLNPNGKDLIRNLVSFKAYVEKPVLLKFYSRK